MADKKLARLRKPGESPSAFSNSMDAARVRTGWLCARCWLVSWTLLVGIGSQACGQTNLPPAFRGTLAQAPAESVADPILSQAELQQMAAETAEGAGVAAPEPNQLGQGNINFLRLLIDGGALMIPIGIMSLLVVAFTIERFWALHSTRLFPRGLRRELLRAASGQVSALPPDLFESAQRHPSVASRVLRDMLQKVGRPVPEIESALIEATQREGDRMYANVRWLTLAAAVTPLIGLLGTVWGMIIAFYNTSHLGAGTNKAEYLAEGIYVALVTTLGGLAVAIPAAIFAHYFEGRITKVLAAIDQDLRRMIPRFEKHEGKARYDVTQHGLVRRAPSENADRADGEPARRSTPASRRA